VMAATRPLANAACALMFNLHRQNRRAAASLVHTKTPSSSRGH
jgi:hypothetical protein